MRQTPLTWLVGLACCVTVLFQYAWPSLTRSPQPQSGSTAGGNVTMLFGSNLGVKNIAVSIGGQPATVRLTALNQRTTPVLDGEVYYVSADAITDGTGAEMREIYLARISIPVEQLDRVHNFVPTPGMPAEIMIQTASRTFVQYISKPIKDSMTRAFREQ